jgi:hypothetical protein
MQIRTDELHSHGIDCVDILCYNVVYSDRVGGSGLNSGNSQYLEFSFCDMLVPFPKNYGFQDYVIEIIAC